MVALELSLCLSPLGDLGKERDRQPLGSPPPSPDPAIQEPHENSVTGAGALPGNLGRARPGWVAGTALCGSDYQARMGALLLGAF